MNVILNQIRKIANESKINEKGYFEHPNIKYNDTLWYDLTIKNIELSQLELEDELYELEVFYAHNEAEAKEERLNTTAFHSTNYDIDKREINIAVSIIMLRTLYYKSEDISLSELETTYHTFPFLFASKIQT